MRCLIMAARDAPITALLTVLTEQGLEPVSSVDLGAGASLGAADLADITFAVAVLPETVGDTRPVAPGRAAILVEIGIAVGRGIPTLVITDPDSPPTQALATMPQAAIDLKDRDTLRLHVGVFARTSIAEHRLASRPTELDLASTKLDAATERGRLHEILDRSGPVPALTFERFVVDLLSRAAGGQVETNAMVREVDGGVDAVIGLGGPNGPPLVILVEIKRLRRSPAGLAEAAHQLLHYLATRRADLGLIVLDQPISDAARDALPPMILAFSADELLDQLAREPLDQILRRARNRAVHGV
jgi:hypothetical protein